MMAYGIIKERFTRFKHNMYHNTYGHQSDKINTGDYRLNNEYVKEYFRRDDELLAFSMTVGGIRMCKDVLKEVFDYKQNLGSSNRR